MERLSVSVSKLDGFAKMVRAEDDCPDFLTEETYIAELKERRPQIWQARYGEALHACIENFSTVRERAVGGGPAVFCWPNAEGVVTEWPTEIVATCWDEWPRGCLWERAMEKDYVGDGWTCTVRARTDAVWGQEIVEGKTRFGPVRPLDYAGSLQHRFYLDLLPWATCVQYRVHEIGGLRAEPGETEPRVSKTGVVLKGIHVWREWREERNPETCQEWVGRFVEWARSRDLTGYLQPKPEQAA